MPLRDDLKRYVVLEGNRRLAALRVLENPEVLIDAVPKGMLATLRRLSKQYHESGPVEEVACAVVTDRDEGRHWIVLRHTGENDGVGVVPWSSDDRARFKARGGLPPVHTQVLDFLEERGDLAAQTRRGFPTASLQRLVGTRAIQDKTGFEIRDGQLMLLAEAKDVARALLHIVNDLASGGVKTGDIYRIADREQYARSLPRGIVVTPTRARGQGVPVSGAPSATTRRGGGRVRVARPRPRLIPRDCVLNVTDARCRQVETELRKLNIEDFPNAVSVLFRVFVELSADAYIEREKPATSVDEKLAKKLQAVTEHLISKKKLTRQQAAPVRRSYGKDSFLAPSVTLMHQYVHNPHMFPIPSDLRSYWDNLQPFFIALWAP
jgi:hypothetical protein